MNGEGIKGGGDFRISTWVLFYLVSYLALTTNVPKLADTSLLAE
jgi:hypothetical protein